MGTACEACFLVCSPSILGAEPSCASAHGHGRVVALEGDAYTKGLRFVPSFSCGRARWTRVAHEDKGLARVAHRDVGSCIRKDLREGRRRDSEAEGRGIRALMMMEPPV